jgi:hypothetical protein
VVFASDVEEQLFFAAKIFALEEVTITLWGNDCEMPVYFDITSSYTVDDIGVKSVELRHLTVKRCKRLNGCNVDRVGRQHETLTICNI